MGIEGKRCKPKGYVICSRKFPKSRESFAHSGTEASRTPNYLTKRQPLHGILSLKQQAQKTEKEY
jgi:hypothetical protein